jgi:glutathione synthase
MRKVAFVMDPLDGLNLKKDSTLAIIRATQRRGWQIRYMTQGDLFYRDDRCWAFMRELTLSEAFVENLDPARAGADWYRLGDARPTQLSDCDAIFMRKDPPFDMEYIYTTYLLERAEADDVLVVNRPASLRDCNEKFFATAFPQCGPSLVVTRRDDVIREFQALHKNTVLKRIDGMGGAFVFRMMEGDPNLSVVIETLTKHGQEQIMAQKFLPEIAAGDKRILMVNGEPIPYALARIPKAGEARGNLAAGGTGDGRPLTDRDRWIAAEVGPELKRRGLYFVGLDVIGDYLTEVNVTCPTCIRELDTQFGLDIAGKLVDCIEIELDRRRRGGRALSETG